MTSGRICSRCKAVLDKDMVFCHSCGLKVDAIVEAQQSIEYSDLDKQSNFIANSNDFPQKKTVRKNSKVVIMTVSAVIGIFFLIVGLLYGLPRISYSLATSAFEDGRYASAMRGYKIAGNYLDADDKEKLSTKANHYDIAKAAFEVGDYGKAIENYSSAGNYKDAVQLSKKSKHANHYYLAVSTLNEGKFEEAIKHFQDSNNYKDASTKILEAYYKLGDAETKVKSNLSAAKAYAKAGDYSDAKDKAFDSAMILLNAKDYASAAEAFDVPGDEQSQQYKNYAEGLKAYDSKDYSLAAEKLAAAGDVGEAHAKLQESNYELASAYFANKEYLSAAESYAAADDYQDSVQKVTDSALLLLKDKDYDAAEKAFGLLKDSKSKQYSDYSAGMRSLASKNYDSAIQRFKAAGDVEDAKTLFKEANYEKAKVFFKEKNYDKARTHYADAGDLKDAKSMLIACDLMVAEKEWKAGNLITANELYEKLPTDYFFDDISVAKRQASLQKFSAFIAMNGVWEAGRSSKYEVAQVSKSYGSSNSWYMTDTNFYQSIDVKCYINDDDTVTIKGSVAFNIYTEYSSISAGLRDKEINRSFEVKVTSVPNGLKIDEYTTITFNNNKWTLNYYHNSTNESVYFNYTYTANYVYDKHIKKY